MLSRALLCAVIVCGAVTSGSASAKVAVQIEDPFGDANFVNDQGNSGVYDHDNNPGPVPDLSDDGDILAVYFTHDRSTVSVNVQLEHDPTSTGAAHHRPALLVEVAASPPAGEPSEAGCLRWTALFEANVAPPYGRAGRAHLYDVCSTPGTVTMLEAKLSTRTLPDGSGLVVMTSPRAGNSLLAPGRVLSAPWASTRAAVASAAPPEADPRYPVIDTTVVGKDYPLRIFGLSRRRG